MDQAFLDDMRQKLMKEKEILAKELATISAPDIADHVPGDRAATFPNYGNDALDENTESPQEVADYSVNLDATETLNAQYKKVEAALARLETGAYGICQNCGKPIPQERLAVNPSAETCVDCSRKK